MPADQQATYAKLLGDDKGRLVVVSCGFPKCGRSHNAAVWAKKLGCASVVRSVVGIKAWDEADYPVEKSEQSMATRCWCSSSPRSSSSPSRTSPT